MTVESREYGSGGTVKENRETEHTKLNLDFI
jgi:hypothetical protein